MVLDPHKDWAGKKGPRSLGHETTGTVSTFTENANLTLATARRIYRATISRLSICLFRRRITLPAGKVYTGGETGAA